MPTGYTAGIEDGTIKTVKDFARLCVRAFGAAVHMKDDSLNVEYTERKPSTYHIDCLNDLTVNLKSLNALTDEELVEAEVKALKHELLTREIELDKRIQLSSKINSFVKAIRKKRFSEEFKNVQTFMLEQLKSTLDYDCDNGYVEADIERIKLRLNNLDAKEIRQTSIDYIQKEIDYHTVEHLKEVERCSEANNWVKRYFVEIETL